MSFFNDLLEKPASLSTAPVAEIAVRATVEAPIRIPFIEGDSK